MKPRLPLHIEYKLPQEVVRRIDRFVPHIKRKPASPGLQTQLTKLQRSPKMTSMGMYGLEDFTLL